MTDIVERARERMRSPSSNTGGVDRRLLADMADEIDSLRFELQCARDERDAARAEAQCARAELKETA